MQSKFILLFFYISLINNVFATSEHDLNKYGKLEKINDALVVFDSHDFKVDEEIYIIITGYFFETYIQYKFIDNLDDLNDINDDYYIPGSIKEESNKVDFLDNYNLERRYYTIEKTNSHLKGKEGKFLALFVYMNGAYDIENTKENKGNSKIVIACVVVGVVVIIAVVAIICYCRRRKMQNQFYQNNIVQQNVNVQNNNNINNTPYNNGAPYNNGNTYNNNTPYNNPNSYNNGINSNNAFNNGNNNYNGYNQNY